MSDLRQAAQQALETLEDIFGANKVDVGAINALRAALAEPVQEPIECEPQYANEDGWCEWVCPNPTGYLMQCCDCGLIHEVESRVAKYQPRPSEEFEVVDDPDLQVQWRMKRRDDISPKQPPQRPAEPVQEPFCYVYEYDSPYGLHREFYPREYNGMKPSRTVPLYAAPPQRPAEPVQEPVEPVAYIHRQGRHWEVSERPLADDEKARGWTEEPLYTSPPQRKPLTDEELERLWYPSAVIAEPGKRRVAFGRAVERAHGIGGEE